MRKNIKIFDDRDAMRNEVMRRAKLILRGRGVSGICLNSADDQAMRELAGKGTIDCGKVVIEDDHIADAARQIVDDSIYFA